MPKSIFQQKKEFINLLHDMGNSLIQLQTGLLIMVDQKTSYLHPSTLKMSYQSMQKTTKIFHELKMRFVLYDMAKRPSNPMPKKTLITILSSQKSEGS